MHHVTVKELGSAGRFGYTRFGRTLQHGKWSKQDTDQTQIMLWGLCKGLLDLFGVCNARQGVQKVALQEALTEGLLLPPLGLHIRKRLDLFPKKSILLLQKVPTVITKCENMTRGVSLIRLLHAVKEGCCFCGIIVVFLWDWPFGLGIEWTYYKNIPDNLKSGSNWISRAAVHCYPWLSDSQRTMDSHR